MPKVNLSAGISANAAVTADVKPEAALSPRHNLYCVNESGCCEYVTTERADSFEEACALAAVKYPGREFTPDPPVNLSKLKKPKDSPRKNLFVMQDGQPVYFTTEIADTHAEAKSQAQAKHPGVPLLCEDDLT